MKSYLKILLLFFVIAIPSAALAQNKEKKTETIKF